VCGRVRLKLTDVGRESIDCINLAQIKDHWDAVVVTVLNNRLKNGDLHEEQNFYSCPEDFSSAELQNRRKGCKKNGALCFFSSDTLHLNISVKSWGLRAIFFKGLKFNSGFLRGVYIASSTIRTEAL
jgi:hypothetical protein